LFVFPGETNNNHRQYNQLQEHKPFPEKQTIIIVNTINYKYTSHSPRKTNKNRRQYNQLQEHKPFPVFRGMACVLVVDCIDDDYCLFFGEWLVFL
jgi:hypothetical protein